MDKKITGIDSCEHCPLKYASENWYDPEYLCGHAGSEGMHLNDISIIHPECLLEDDD